ncbi:MAG: tetratricopeptide repeat protein [Elusimicrobia bacterium]|nr:tetratricopeptide repeat protein [Elusimicrobiota bacterium]
MIWADEKFLLFLILLPFIILLLFFDWFKRNKKSLKFAENFEKLSTRIKRIEILRRILVVFAYSFFVLACAGPKWGHKKAKITQKGYSIIFALDFSWSMASEDVMPNRFLASVMKIKKIVSMLPGSQFGLIGFAGDAFPICPLTDDVDSFKMFLDEVEVGSIRYPGTNIASFILLSQKMFSNVSRNKIVIVFTDGENTYGNIEDALKKIKGQEIHFFIFGVGTPEGEPIPIRDKKGNLIEYKKDKNGNTVISKMDEQTLLKLANKTKGIFIRLKKTDDDVEEVVSKIKSLDRDLLKSFSKELLIPRWHIPLFMVFLFMFFDMILPRISKRRTFLKHISTILLFFIFYGISNASMLSKGNRAFKKKEFFKAEKFYRKGLEKKPDPRLYYNLGNVFYIQKKYDEAEKQYEKALTFDKIKFKEKIYYNLANNSFKKGDVAKAVEYYRKALKLKPDDKDALWNLEVALKSLKKGKRNKNQQQQKNKQQKEQQRKAKTQRILNMLEDVEKRKKMKKYKMPKVWKDW